MMRFPRAIQLQSSLWLRVLLVGFHGLTAAVFFSIAWHMLPMAVTAMLMLGLAGSAFLADRAERRKAGLTLILGESGLLSIVPDKAESATLQSGCVDQGWAVWLCWHMDTAGTSSRGGAMMLVAGNLSLEDKRYLHIWLRHKASVDVGA